jgi:hypothetical protein
MTRADQLPTPMSREAVINFTALVVSLLCNGLVVVMLGALSMLQSQPRTKASPFQEEEMVVSLEELLPELLPEPEAAKAKQLYAETFSDQEAEQAPERAPFESDRNTRAATEVVPDKPGEMPVPTQEGLDLVKALSMRDHNFAEGPDAEIPRSAPSAPGMPVPPSPPKPMEAAAVPPAEPPPPEAIPKETKEQPEETSPTEMAVVENPDRGKAEEAPPEKVEAPDGPAGGVPERMEMAKLDVEARTRELGDATMEGVAPEPKMEDAMPEKAPQLADPTMPFFQTPRVRPSALVAPPEMERPEPVPPMPPGAKPQPLTNGQADLAAFSPARKLNTMKGSLSNLGKSAVDAEATPVGAYKASVSRAIERRWHELRQKNGSFVSYGSLKIGFLVNARGKVSGIRVLHQDAGAVLTDFSIAAIATAPIPAMPPDVAEAFGNDPLEVNYDILIY